MIPRHHDPVFWCDVDLDFGGSDTGIPQVATREIKKRLLTPGPGVREFETCNWGVDKTGTGPLLDDLSDGTGPLIDTLSNGTGPLIDALSGGTRIKSIGSLL